MIHARAHGRSGSRFPSYGGIFDLARIAAELKEIDEHTGRPDFWKDTKAATKVTRRKATLDREVARWRDIERRQSDLGALIELAEESGDTEIEQELARELSRFEQAVDQLRTYLTSSTALVDSHSADQLVLPLCLAAGPSEYAVAEVTQHLTTNVAVVRRFLERGILIEGEEGGPGVVRIADGPGYNGSSKLPETEGRGDEQSG